MVSQNLKKELADLEGQVDAMLERDAQMESQVLELDAEKRDMLARIDAADRAQQAAMEPVVAKLEQEISVAKSEIAVLQASKKEKEKQQALYFTTWSLILVCPIHPDHDLGAESGRSKGTFDSTAYEYHII